MLLERLGGNASKFRIRTLSLDSVKFDPPT